MLCWLAAGDNSIDKADIKRLKESGVFGPLTFWVTEIKNLEELGNPNAGVRVIATALLGSPSQCVSSHCASHNLRMSL